MITACGASPTVQTLVNSHIASIYGSGGGFCSWVDHSCLHAQNGLTGAFTNPCACLERVTDVFGMSTPFEVFRVAMEFVAVDVVDLGIVVRIRDECDGYEAVDIAVVLIAIFVEDNVRIAVRVERGSEDFATAFNSAVIGDTVVGESSDAFPKFHKIPPLLFCAYTITHLKFVCQEKEP